MSSTATQAERMRQLADNEVTFSVRLSGPFRIPHGPRPIHVLLDLDKPPAVRLFGLRIKQLTST